MNIELIEYQLINYKYEIFINNQKDSRGRGSILVNSNGNELLSSIDNIIKDDIKTKLRLNNSYSILITDKEIINKSFYNITKIERFKYLTINNILLGLSLLGFTYYLLKNK